MSWSGNASRRWRGITAATAYRVLDLLVRRERRVDLVDPGEDAAADVYRVGEARGLKDREDLGAAGAALAVQHDLLVLRHALQGRAVQELALRDQRGAGDADDLVLVRLTDVHQEDVVAPVEHARQVLGADRRADHRGLGLFRDGAAEGLVVDQLGDRRVLAADRAVRVLVDLDRAVVHLQGVVDHQAAGEAVADAGDQLDRLVHLDRADRGAEHAEDAALGAGRNHAGGRRLRVEAAVAGAVLGPEHAGLAVEPVDRAPHVRLVQQHAGVVDQVTGGEVVGPVHDQVVRTENVERVVGVQPLLVQHDLDVRVHLKNASAGRFGLGTADVGDAVDDLPLQVRLVHHVEVDDAERADAGRGQVQQRGRAETAGPDHQHLGVLQPLLPGHAHVGDDEVPRVALHLVHAELVGRLDQGWQRHRSLQTVLFYWGRDQCGALKSTPTYITGRAAGSFPSAAGRAPTAAGSRRS